MVLNWVEGNGKNELLGLENPLEQMRFRKVLEREALKTFQRTWKPKTASEMTST